MRTFDAALGDMKEAVRKVRDGEVPRTRLVTEGTRSYEVPFATPSQLFNLVDDPEYARGRLAGLRLALAVVENERDRDTLRRLIDRG